MDKKSAVAYVRVSTTGQTREDSFGLPAQREAIRTYADQAGFDVIAWYEDAGISGGTLDRPGLQSMLTDAASGTFSAVIVAKADRIARDLMMSLWVEKELLKSNVEIVSVSEPFRGSDPSSILFRQIIGAFAEFEKSMITSRLSGGRKSKAKTGGFSGGRATFGYSDSRGSKAMVVADREAATVRRVYAIRGEYPSWSLQAISDQMNAEGYTTRQGSAFTKMQVSRILKHEAIYRGAYQYSGIVAIQGQHEAILG